MRDKTINWMGIIAVIAAIVIVLNVNGAFATTTSGGGSGGGGGSTTAESYSVELKIEETIVETKFVSLGAKEKIANTDFTFASEDESGKAKINIFNHETLDSDTYYLEPGEDWVIAGAQVLYEERYDGTPVKGKFTVMNSDSLGTVYVELGSSERFGDDLEMFFDEVYETTPQKVRIRAVYENSEYAGDKEVTRDLKIGEGQIFFNKKLMFGTEEVITAKYLIKAVGLAASASGGGGSGGGGGVPTCPAHYTCPDGTIVPWCSIEEGDDGAGCACIISPESQCPSVPIRLPSVSILSPRNGDIVTGKTRIVVKGTGSYEDMELSASVCDSTGTYELEAYECNVVQVAQEVTCMNLNEEECAPQPQPEITYEKKCTYIYDFSKSTGKAEISTDVSDANGGSATSITVFAGTEYKNTLTFVVRDARTYEPVENAKIVLSESGICVVDESGVETCAVEVTAETTVAAGGVVTGAKATAIVEEIEGRVGQIAYTNSEGIASFKVSSGRIYDAVITKSGYLRRAVRSIYIEPEIGEGIAIKKVIYLKPLVDEDEDEVRPIEPPPFPEEEEEVTATIKIYKGWNLISLPGKYVEGIGSTCTAKNPIAFVYLKDRKEYVSIQEAMEILGNDGLKKYLAENAFWIYSYENCKITFKLEEYTSFNDVSLVKGWNLVPVTVDMEDLTLADITGGCELKSSYIWDTANQEWETLESEYKFKSTDLHNGILLKANSACVLGGAELKPPELEEPVEEPIVIEPAESACINTGGTLRYSDCNGHCTPETKEDRIKCEEKEYGCPCTTVCVPGYQCVCPEGLYWGSKEEGCIER